MLGAQYNCRNEKSDIQWLGKHLRCSDKLSSNLQTKAAAGKSIEQVAVNEKFSYLLHKIFHCSLMWFSLVSLNVLVILVYLALK